MHVDGDKSYVSRLDTIKLTTFLREQGMSEQDRESLRIHFTKKKRLSWDGTYNTITHTITIATSDSAPGKFSSFTKKSQQEILYELNETLMHEIQHALDVKNKRIQILLWLLNALCIMIPLWLTWFLLKGTVWYWLLFILICVVGSRLSYHALFLERRARAFEKRYGRSYLLFRQ